MKFFSHRLLFILLSLVFVIGAFYVYSSMVKPAYSQVSELRSQLASRTDSLARYDIAFLKLKNMLSNQNITQLNESVSRVLPNKPDVAYLSAQLVGFARVNNLSVVSLSNSLEPTKNSNSKIIRSVGKVKTVMEVRGTYASVRTYIQQIENNQLIMDVSDVKISPIKDKEKESTVSGLKYVLTIMSYYQVQ